MRQCGTDHLLDAFARAARARVAEFRGIAAGRSSNEKRIDLHTTAAVRATPDSRVQLPTQPCGELLQQPLRSGTAAKRDCLTPAIARWAERANAARIRCKNTENEINESNASAGKDLLKRPKEGVVHSFSEGTEAATFPLFLVPPHDPMLRHVVPPHAAPSEPVRSPVLRAIRDPHAV
jgi:hypothetical protein